MKISNLKRAVELKNKRDTMQCLLDADDNKFHHTFAFDSVAKRCESYHFTKDELVKYSAWENDYYDTCEVENEIKRTN